MKRFQKIIYYSSLGISLMVGFWHFFVPALFQWNDYLPTQYENLIVAVHYINYCFSIFLFGTSLLLIVLGRKAFSLNKEVLIFHSFLTIIWIFRACLASFIEPWPLDPSPIAAIMQLIMSDVLAVMMTIVNIYLWKEVRKNKSEK